MGNESTSADSQDRRDPDSRPDPPGRPIASLIGSLIGRQSEENVTQTRNEGGDILEDNTITDRPNINVQGNSTISLLDVSTSPPLAASANNSSAPTEVPRQEKQDSLYSIIVSKQEGEKQQEEKQNRPQNQVPVQVSSQNTSQDVPAGGADGEARRVIDRYLGTISLRLQNEWRLDESGMWAFTYQALKFVIEVPATGTKYYLYTTAFPGMKQNEVPMSTMKQMLRFNYLSTKTRGGCLAFEKEGLEGEIIFSFSGHYPELSGDTEFQLILENFMDVALKFYEHFKTDTDTISSRCCYRFLSFLPQRFRKRFEKGNEFQNRLPAMNERELSNEISEEGFRKVNSYLSDISQSVGKNLSLNESGVCAFTYDDFTIVIEVPKIGNTNDFFYVYSILPGIKAESSRAIMKKALQLNYLSLDTRGGILSIDDTDALIFHYRDRSTQLTSTVFRYILENFIDSLMNLHSEFGSDKLYVPLTATVPTLTSFEPTSRLSRLLNFRWWRVQNGLEEIRWAEVVQCINQSPEDAMTQYKFVTSSGRKKLYPIHQALSLFAPLEVVAAFYNASPRCLEVGDPEGDIALQYAIHNYQPDMKAAIELIKFMIEKHPEAVDAKNSLEGKTAMHWVGNIAMKSLDPVKLLLSVSPHALEVQDLQGRLPIHHVLERTTTRRVASFLVKKYPESCNIADNSGLYPLHYAAFGQKDVSIVRAIVDANPDILMKGDSYGNTPLHIASNSVHVSLEVIKYLVNENPSALAVLNNSGFTPLQNASRGRRDRGELIFCLAQYYSREETKELELENTNDLILSYLSASIEDQEDISTSVILRRNLNSKFLKPHIPAIILFNLYTLIATVLGYHYVVKSKIEDLLIASFDSSFDPSLDSPPSFYGISMAAQFIGIIWWALQEVMDFVAKSKVGRANSYLLNVWNWVDNLSILCILIFIISILSDHGDMSYYKSLDFFINLSLCLKIISFLKAFQVDFAVFVSGIINVVKRLLSFLVILFIILWIFSHLLQVAFFGTPDCLKVFADHSAYCTDTDGLFTAYTFLLGDFDPSQFNTLYTKIIFVIFTFISVIVLFNVLIGIVTKSYDEVAEKKAEARFWISRAEYLSELDVAFEMFFSKRGNDDLRKRWEIFERRKEGAWNWWMEGIYGTPEEPYGGDIESYKKWILYRDIWLPKVGGKKLKALRMYCLRLSGIVIIPVWIIVGFLSLGVAWPVQFKTLCFLKLVTSKEQTEINKESATLKSMKRIEDQLNDEKMKTKELQEKIDVMLEILRPNNE